MSLLYQRHQRLVLAVISYLAGISTGMLINLMQSSNLYLNATRERDDATPQESTRDGSFRICFHEPHDNKPRSQSSEQESSTKASAPIDKEETIYMSSSADTLNMIKFKRTSEYKNESEEMSNMVTFENEEIRKSRLIQAFTVGQEYSEVVKEIIPVHLLPRYAEEFLQFPTTR